MKRAVRMLILMVGLACTYVAIATPILNAELGPMPLCNPANPNCSKASKASGISGRLLIAAQVALDLTGLTDCESHGQPSFFVRADPAVLAFLSFSASRGFAAVASGSVTGG